MTVKLYEVGGCVRDELMDVPCKDVDFSVEADSFNQMKEFLLDSGFTIFLETPEFLTIRATPPKDSLLRERTNGADFVLCRKDSEDSDGRRPDYVEVGTIYDDLARRDFTINAIAKDLETGKLIDPHDGIADIEMRCLRFVGDGEKRIKEDGLRVVRGLRFQITKSLIPHSPTFRALRSNQAARSLAIVSKERIVVELEKMFKHDTVKSMGLINSLPDKLLAAMFRDNIRLSATLKQ